MVQRTGAVLLLPAQKFENVIISCIRRRGGDSEGGVPVGQYESGRRATSHAGLTGKSCARYAGAAALGGKSAANAEPAADMIAATANSCSKLMFHDALQCLSRLWL